MGALENGTEGRRVQGGFGHWEEPALSDVKKREIPASPPKFGSRNFTLSLQVAIPFLTADYGGAEPSLRRRPGVH